MADSPPVLVLAATTERWADLVAVFGTRGDPSWCWCQYFLTTGRGYEDSAENNRAALAQQVAGSRPPGLVAYLDGEPVGWVQVGPRPSYPRITGNRALVRARTADPQDGTIWSVTCFVVRVGRRRRGISAALLDAAVQFAREHGASAVEGYPVDVAARTTKVGGAELYHGVASTFVRAGFREVARTGATRPVMLLDLG